jgi:hypothetical protein
MAGILFPLFASFSIDFIRTGGKWLNRPYPSKPSLWLSAHSRHRSP